MFDPYNFINQKVADLKAHIGDKTAIIACSGGVDSTTAAVLVARAIGNRLIAVFVDTGFLRKNEPENVKTLLKKLGLNFKYVDARAEFFNALKGVIEPEEKRKIIGERFGRIFERIAEEVSAKYLVQGTIAPDWIESGGALRDTIKTHHNVGGLPVDLKIDVVEPLRDLYKDEIRKVASALKLDVASKQPFPGPGLAIRVIGEATPERVEIVREACAIVEEEIESAVRTGKINRPWQYFAVLLPIKSVGVHGDLRAYGHTIAVRIVESVDGMTAAYFKIPYEILERISARITNTIKSVNRVVYDITHKPPSTIEWE
jgi:GMP synthase (glutamine-hydrolysing)